jgi:hypothetical protein
MTEAVVNNPQNPVTIYGTDTSDNVVPVDYIASTTTSAGEAATPVVIQDGSRLAAIWSGGDETGAPDAELFGVGQAGADGDGVAAAHTYHVVGAVGAKAWVATGGTVTTLYGT